MIIFIIIVAFIISVIIAVVLNKNKEKKFENSLSEAEIKTKKNYKGSITRYVNEESGKTILRYFTSGKTNTISDFTPTEDILVGNCLILFDEHRKKISIINDIRKHGHIETVPFSDVVSLQPVEISKTKKVTRGGISPIAIAGYRWASVTTRSMKEIQRVYIEIKYNGYNKENTYEIPIFDGISYEDRSSYEKVVEKVNIVINKFHDIIARN